MIDTATKNQALANLLNRGIVCLKAGRLDEALELYRKSEATFADLGDPLMSAKFHNGYAGICEEKGKTDPEFYDKAILEFEAAKIYIEQTDDATSAAVIENNIASVLARTGKYSEAHQRLDNAEPVLRTHPDKTFYAMALETRARCLYGEKRYREAAIVINKSEAILLHGIELDPLVETLKTKRKIHMALEAQICLEYGNARAAGEKFGIGAHGVRKKIKEYFG